MANLFDELQMGTISRRRLFELLPVAGASALVARAQGTAEEPKLSPANIGGGGRIERDFYRQWIKNSKLPMVEGYSILDAAKQEVQPWPETGGRGLYLNFSGNVHMDAVIQEIPPGKALTPGKHFYEQLTYVLSGRGYTTFSGVGKGNKSSGAKAVSSPCPPTWSTAITTAIRRTPRGSCLLPHSPLCCKYLAAWG